jgi:predicted amidohydrolase
VFIFSDLEIYYDHDRKGQKLQAANLFIGIGIQFFASHPNSDSYKGALALILKMKCAAIAQLCSTASKRKNLENIAKCANMAKWHGASMLFLPECFGFIGSSPQQTLANAEVIPHSDVNNASVETKTKTNHYHSFQEKQNELLPWLSDLEQIVETGEKKRSADASTSQKDGDAHSQNSEISILRGLRTIAVKSGLWISGGGIHEKGAPPSPVGESSHSRVYNTHIIIDSNGKIVTKYRKVHLFDVSIPSEGVNLRESATTAPGSKLVVCDSPIGKLGLSVCYDLRFPEMYTKLVEEGGADILLVPSAFTVPTGRAHWHTLLRGKNTVYWMGMSMNKLICLLSFAQCWE